MRLVVQFSGGKYANILADNIEREDSIVYAYYKNSLVAVIDIGSVMYLYLSEQK